ncbi:MAG TPA: hypothetical protein DCQ31_13305, partial [Bacteroidales bacterium]|nr:hypothetical protein [Bacteroidales bacterium]
DFGRRRASDAINLNYYFSTDFSLQAVYIPFFQPANLPVGVFSSVLNPDMTLPQGMTLKAFEDKVLMPKFNLKESGKYAVKFKGSVKGIDFSVSYINGLNELPTNTRNTITPVDLMGGVKVSSELSFERMNIIGADAATTIGAVGVWVEGAVFTSNKSVFQTTDLSAFYPMSPVPVTIDSFLIDKAKPAFKFIAGADYSFANGGYVNVQYMHGFMHEKARADLNDYFFVRYDHKFFNEKLKIAPVSGAFIVTDWSNLKENYAFAYMPQVSYMANNEVELALSTVLFGGKGNNMFAKMKDFNMLMFTMKYSF